jgi:hypothetical protein
LHQKTRQTHLPGLGFKDPDEMLAYDASFLFGLGHTLQGTHELVNGVDGDQLDAQRVLEDLDDLPRLVFAQQTRIHKNSHQLIANGG